MPPARWRRLAAFTFVCIVSLGIGMVPVIAVPYLARIPSTPPPGVNTEGLVEVITTPIGSRPADQLVVLSGLHGPARRRIPGLRSSRGPPRQAKSSFRED